MLMPLAIWTGLAGFVSGVVGFLLYRRLYGPLTVGRWVDCCLCALALAVLGGRALHVLLNWPYFSERLAEAIDPRQGGLDWAGALAGGLLGAALGARWRRIPLASALDVLTPALPLIALAGWSACAGDRCGAGAEIHTLAYVSPLVAAELPDVYGIIAPRFQTQLWGQSVSLCLLLLTGLLFWRGWLPRIRFWLVLVHIVGLMLTIGLFRG
jgi:prolipoprotein diacylglyceryltransferase